MGAVSEQPIRGELFSVDLLQRHARTLAQLHEVGPRRDPARLLLRLTANEKVLRTYNDRPGRGVAAR
jgi:cyclic beta-1,2-glucan synthetase